MTDHNKELERIEAENKKLADQIAENDKRRAAIVAENKNKVIAEIQANIKKYDITHEEIFGASKIVRVKKVNKANGVPVFLYKNEKGEGWTGGRGATPKWVKDIKASGGDIEKYRIKN